MIGVKRKYERTNQPISFRRNHRANNRTGVARFADAAGNQVGEWQNL
jgi:hypothetical protein